MFRNNEKVSKKIIDLVITDPPYCISKVKWDKWGSIKKYIDFMGKVFKEIEKLLKSNGSFYFFHNNFPLLARLHLWIEDNTNFVYKNLIVWNKRFKGCKNKGYLDGFLMVDNLKKYQQMAEYILFYTFQDEKYLYDINKFKNLREYFKKLHKYIGLTKKKIIDIIGQVADHCFRYESSQWSLPTEETYNKLIKYFKIDEWSNFRNYESLKKEYEKLKKEYEYTFNNLKTHHSVWNYDFEDKKICHITPKPVALIENILKHSSNENDLVLDCFLGSGTVAVACEKLNRRWIGIEINSEYCEIAKNRILEVVNEKCFKSF